MLGPLQAEGNIRQAYKDKVDPYLNMRFVLEQAKLRKKGISDRVLLGMLVEVDSDLWRPEAFPELNVMGQIGEFVSVIATRRDVLRLALNPAVTHISGGRRMVMETTF